MLSRGFAAALGLWGCLVGGPGLAQQVAQVAQEEGQEPRQEVVPPVELSGTLAKVRASGRIALGYRASSIPFSYLDRRGNPIGYSIELCKALAASIGEAVHRDLAIQWVPVTAGNRVDAVADGRVDLECGSTTSNLERQKRVAFSPIIFVAGTKALVGKESPIRGFRDLAGKRVAVTRGTTNEKAVEALMRRFQLDIRLVHASEQGQGFELLATGQADAFASDDVLLHGFMADSASAGSYRMVGDYLSYDPYAIMMRKDDPQLAQVVRRSFQALAATGEIERQYKRWFLSRLPSGASIGLPMSAQLATIIETMAVKAE